MSDKMEKVFEQISNLEKKVAGLEKVVQPEKGVKGGEILKSKNEDILEKLYDVLVSNQATYRDAQEILNALRNKLYAVAKLK